MEDWCVVDGGLVCDWWSIGVWLEEDWCVIDGGLVCG
jgi:hypothetical protein